MTVAPRAPGPVRHRERWTTLRPPGDVLYLVRVKSELLGGTTTPVEDFVVEAKTGSQIRLRGENPFRGDPREWPVRTRVVLEPGPEATTVTVLAQDDMQIGVHFGFRAKFQEAVTGIAAYLRHGIEGSDDPIGFGPQWDRQWNTMPTSPVGLLAKPGIRRRIERENAAAAETLARNPYLSVPSLSARTDPEHRTCPRCAEQIRFAAVVCRYCQSELGPTDPG